MDRKQLMPALISKVEELKMLGYEHATVDEVWECLQQKKWKKGKGEKRLFELISDILSLRPNEYMNYIVMKEQKASQRFSDDAFENLDDLF